MNNSLSEWIAVVNPKAGGGKVAIEWPVLSAVLKEKKVSFDEVFTTHRYHAVELVIYALKLGYRKIISVGGDGTLHEVVNGIFHQTEVPVRDVTLAVLPAGSGNDWAKMYGVPVDYDKAAELIVKERTLLQDVGKVVYMEAGVTNSRYMVNVAGIGLDANICYYCNKAKRENGRKGSYIKAAVNALMGRRFNETEVKADGRTFFKGKMFSIGFGIGKYSGGGMIQVPDAIADDGLINLMVARKLPKLKFAFLFRELFKGTIYEIKQVQHTMGKKFEVSTENPDRIEIDGEVVGTTPMSLEVIPNTLRVVTGRMCGNMAKK